MDPYVGEIRPVAFNYAPAGWLLCSGQPLPISSYETLYAVIGTTYGGDGIQNFKLPNLMGQAVLGQGQNGGGVNHIIGQSGGAAFVSLTPAQMPVHSHSASVVWTTPPSASGQVAVATTSGSKPSPIGNVPASSVAPGRQPVPIATYASASTGATLGGVSVSGSPFQVVLAGSGGGQPMMTLPPGVCINYIIAYTGIFPSQQ